MIASGVQEMQQQEMEVEEWSDTPCLVSPLPLPRPRFMSHSVPEIQRDHPHRLAMDTMLKLDVDALVHECEVCGIQAHYIHPCHESVEPPED